MNDLPTDESELARRWRDVGLMLLREEPRLLEAMLKAAEISLESLTSSAGLISETHQDS